VQKRYLLTGYRIFFAFLAFGAIVTEMATLAERGKLAPFNLFSYFTIEGNVIAAAVLVLSVLAVAQDMPVRLLAMLRGAATLYIVIVGIVFSVLLASIEGAEFTAVPWDNWVLHYIMPIAVAVDWFVDLPGAVITFRDGLVWLAFPVAYVIYSLVRGYLVGWYPYPFLDPATHGFGAVVFTSIGIAVFAAALAWFLTRFTRGKASTA
jgi:hypothetical protein